MLSTAENELSTSKTGTKCYSEHQIRILFCWKLRGQAFSSSSSPDVMCTAFREHPFPFHLILFALTSMLLTGMFCFLFEIALHVIPSSWLTGVQLILFLSVIQVPQSFISRFFQFF